MSQPSQPLMAVQIDELLLCSFLDHSQASVERQGALRAQRSQSSCTGVMA